MSQRVDNNGSAIFWHDAPRVAASGSFLQGTVAQFGPKKVARVPIVANAYYALIGGTSSVGDQYGTLGLNGSRFPGGLSVIVPAWSPVAGTGNGVEINGLFYGSIFGLSYRMSTDVAPFFSVAVDGDYVRVGAYNQLLVQNSYNIIDGNTQWVGFRDLDPDQEHTYRLTFHADAFQQRSYRLLGFLLDSEKYNDYGPLAFINTSPGTLTTAQVALGNGTLPNQFLGLSRVHYVNTSGSAQTVKIQFNSVQIAEFTLTATGTAGAYGFFDPSPHFGTQGMTVAANGFSHACSANSSVNFALVGVK